MAESMIEVLAVQIRREFQIPPDFPDDALGTDIGEGQGGLGKLSPGRDLEKDFTFRMLLKNYVHYAYYHKVNEWEQNYANTILSWQLGSEASE